MMVNKFLTEKSPPLLKNNIQPSGKKCYQTIYIIFIILGVPLRNVSAVLYIY